MKKKRKFADEDYQDDEPETGVRAGVVTRYFMFLMPVTISANLLLPAVAHAFS
jgi:hypothetical protein